MRYTYVRVFIFTGIGIFIMGERLEMFSSPAPRMRKFQKAAVSFLKGFAHMFSIIPWYRFFPTPASIRFVEAVHQLEEITKELIEEKIAKLVKSGISEEECVGFLDQWLMNDKFNKEDINVLVRDFLSAGIDTVSCSHSNRCTYTYVRIGNAYYVYLLHILFAYIICIYLCACNNSL